MWQGLGDLINHFRYAILGLRPLTLTSGPLVLQRLQIPYTYAWSEHLLPKPDDWKGNMGRLEVQGQPNRRRRRVLHHGKRHALHTRCRARQVPRGRRPAHILWVRSFPVCAFANTSFGSIVVDKADQLTSTPPRNIADADIIFNAVDRTGIRALVSAGWAELGDGDDIPDSVFIIRGNVPHDWLFAEGRVAAVCHHGGAGTTAAGLRLGVPTIVVPFFGDQW